MASQGFHRTALDILGFIYEDYQMKNSWSRRRDAALSAVCPLCTRFYLKRHDDGCCPISAEEVALDFPHNAGENVEKIFEKKGFASCTIALK